MNVSSINGLHHVRQTRTQKQVLSRPQVHFGKCVPSNPLGWIIFGGLALLEEIVGGVKSSFKKLTGKAGKKAEKA